MTKTHPARDPFAVLDVPEDADDEAVQRRYLALVRRHPPEQAPEAFQEIRAAFEAIRDKRDRLRLRILQLHGGALTRLKRGCLQASAVPGQPSATTVRALLREGADAWAASILPPADR